MKCLIHHVIEVSSSEQEDGKSFKTNYVGASSSMNNPVETCGYCGGWRGMQHRGRNKREMEINILKSGKRKKKLLRT